MRYYTWQLITTEGRAAIAADPMGDKFPWLPEGAESAGAVAAEK